MQARPRFAIPWGLAHERRAFPTRLVKVSIMRESTMSIYIAAAE